ncbi:hypothetical protein QBC41DRAFT_300779 [Cercophora samala]|uniref:Uncharacterized protein n=1 Tax=Cercophora samala TaxID=330535 RepID=A0AA39ZIG0_9PEZI|nr:hypothetical protein QBC41DRAFT_300779 [Cercophora samala]
MYNELMPKIPARDEEFHSRSFKFDRPEDCLGMVIQEADMVCTPPHAAGDKQWAGFNGAAKAVVLDEAGAMLRLDALMVWEDGYGGR